MKATPFNPETVEIHARNKDIASIRKLGLTFSDVTDRDTAEIPVLQIAFALNNQALFNFCYQEIILLELLGKNDSEGRNLLHFAVACLQPNSIILHAIAVLRGRNLSIDAPEKSQKTALHIAEHVDHCDAISLLVRKGANCFALDSDGASPFEYTLLNANSRKIEALISSMPEDVITFRHPHLDRLAGTTECSLLEFAIKLDQPALINALAKRQVDMNACIKSDKSPLEIALLTRDHPDVIEALIANGADVNTKFLASFNLYELAKRESRTRCIKILAKYFPAEHSKALAQAEAETQARAEAFAEAQAKAQADRRPAFSHVLTRSLSPLFISVYKETPPKIKTQLAKLQLTDYIECLKADGIKNRSTPLFWKTPKSKVDSVIIAVYALLHAIEHDLMVCDDIHYQLLTDPYLRELIKHYDLHSHIPNNERPRSQSL